MTAAIIQARMGSTRLPGKVLMELPPGSGVSVLGRIITELKKCKNVEQVIVATTEEPEDTAVYLEAIKYGAGAYRGSVNDVLSRYYIVARSVGADTIVRITGDCPLITAEIVEDLVEDFLFYADNEFVDIAYNTDCAKGDMDGDGYDCEVFSFETLKKTHNLVQSAHNREHVTPWMRRHLRVLFVPSPEPEGCSLNTQADYERICKIYAQRS